MASETGYHDDHVVGRWRLQPDLPTPGWLISEYQVIEVLSTKR